MRILMKQVRGEIEANNPSARCGEAGRENTVAAADVEYVSLNRRVALDELKLRLCVSTDDRIEGAAIFDLVEILGL
jgi:hypothetical protein